jgi:hypothetical protein
MTRILDGDLLLKFLFPDALVFPEIVVAERHDAQGSAKIEGDIDLRIVV